MSPPEPRATMLAIWQTRPARRQSDRKIAGVAGAIARRYDIDPVLVRIALVVAAFYGVGILLYLAAWVALPPDPNDRPRGPLAGKGSSAHPVVLIAAIVACVAGAGSLMSGDPGVLIGFAVAGALLYLLHQARGDRVAAAPGAVDAAAASPPSPATSTATAPLATAPAATAPATATDPAPATTAPDRQDPPAWDPLGAAPFAWDLPEPGPPPDDEPPPRRRSKLTMATVGLALVAGGITAAIAVSLMGPAGLRLVFGVMLAVVGLGLLVGAIRHAGRGLILAAIPLLLLSYGVTKSPIHARWQGAGDLRVAPRTLAELAPTYGRTFGEITLDLRNLDLTGAAVPPAGRTVPALPPVPSAPSLPAVPTVPTVPAVPPLPTRPSSAPPTAGSAAPTPSHGPAPTVIVTPPGAPRATVPSSPGAVVPVTTAEPARVKVNLEVGDIVVLLPPNADVRVHCEAGLGDVNCLGNQGDDDSPSQDVTVDEDLGADGVAAGRPLELDLKVQTGSVEVRRG